MKRADAEKAVLKAAIRLADRWRLGCTYQAFVVARMELEAAVARLARQKKGRKPRK